MYEELKEQEERGIEQVQVKNAAGIDYENTMRTLREAEKTLPQFKSSYDDEISEIYMRIINRPEFRYSAENDPVYESYRDRYLREGSLAMRSRMGQTAALTGGYASSYSEAVGQQQFDSYLKKLNDVMPELYAEAYERYRDEGKELQSRYETASRAANAEYDRYRDTISDKTEERKIKISEDKLEFEKQQKAYENLYELIYRMGYQPSEQQLMEAGMPKELAELLREEYLKTHGQAGGGGMAYEDIPKPASQLSIIKQAAESSSRARR